MGAKVTECERTARRRLVAGRAAARSGDATRAGSRDDWLLVALLLGAVMRQAGASVETLDDGTKMLHAPWTDADHSEACPNPDSRPCPVLVLNNPAVFIQSQEEQVLLRDVARLTADEEAEGATTPFFLYNYKFDSNLGKKRYTVYGGVDTVEVTFTSTMGSTWFNVGVLESCGVSIDRDQAQAMTQKADLASGPLSFSITNTFPKINCFLGAVRFSKSGGRISSDMQLAQLGAMSTLALFIRSAQTTSNFGSAYKVETVIFYDSIMFQPTVMKTGDVFTGCPSFSYPFPDTTQLPSTGLPAIAQPVAISTWQRDQLRNGQCYSSPIANYPSTMPSELTCPNATYGEGRFAPVCQPCGVTQSDFNYVFEDSPTVMTLSDIQIEDGLFFYGSAKLSMELDFVSQAPTSEESEADMTARQGRLSEFKYCAETSVAATECASTSAEAFGNIWVPAVNEMWGSTYEMRIVPSTDKAVLCIPGTQDCASLEDANNPGQFACVDPSETGDDNIIRCPCNTGLCYSVNGFRTATSKLVSAAAGRSRLWFQVVDTRVSASDPDAVVQMGYLDLYVTDGGVATGLMHSYPSSIESKLNWFRFSPMSISGTYKEDTRRLTLDLRTDVSLHPQVLVTVESDFGLLFFPNTHNNVVATSRTPARTVSFRGSLRELTITLSLIQYQINHVLHPHLNTQTKGRASSEHIRIIYDKSSVTQRIVDPGGVGAVTVFDMPVTIVATNDAPVITIPVNQSAVENVLTRVSGVSLVDLDVDEVFVDSGDAMPSGRCPPLPGEAHHQMTLAIFSKNGKIYVNETGIDSFPIIVVRDGRTDRLKRELEAPVPRDIIRKLLQNDGDVKCGLDSRLLCIMIPSKYFKAPRPTLEEIPVFVGPLRMEMRGTLACLNSALADLRYMGMEDYNNNVPSVVPADKAGCRNQGLQPPEAEAISITIKDAKFSGCVENIEKTHSMTLMVSVGSVEQDLVISRPQEVMALEGFRFSFSSYRCNEVAVDPSATCGAIQVLSRDNGDITLLDRYFRVRLKVRFGTLSIAQSGLAPCVFPLPSSTLCFLIGDGSDDETMQIFGTLCDVNAALRTVSYMPKPDFNTDYEPINKTWTPATADEYIEVFVEQPSVDGSRLIGPTITIILPVSVKAVDKVPMMSLIAAGTGDTLAAAPATRRQTSATLALTAAVHDIYFCGGKVSCVCPASALACVQVEDRDSCDAKSRLGLPCDSRLSVGANPRLSVRSDHSSLWFFDGDVLASWASGQECATTREKSISERHTKEMSDYRPGSKLHALDLIIPLPLIQSGILRIWASKESYGADTIEIALQGAAATDGILVQNLPVRIKVDNTWCATLDPPVCVRADAALTQKLRGSTISGTVIVVLGLLGAGAVMLLCWGLGPGAQITRLTSTNAAMSRPLNAKEALEMSHMQDSIAQLGSITNIHQGQWIMARDNRRRPFWYHTVTRETTWVDPMRTSDQPTQEHEVGRIVGLHDLDYLQSPNALQNVMKDRDQSQDQDVTIDAQFDVTLEHTDTGEQYSTRQIVNKAAPVDFPGAWNAQADINDVDNSFVTAMLLTKSSWVRDHEKAGPLQRLAMERHKQQQAEDQFENSLVGSGLARYGSNGNGSTTVATNPCASSAGGDEHLVAI